MLRTAGCGIDHKGSRPEKAISLFALERVSFGPFEFLVAGECGSEGDEGAEEVGVTFVADGQASVVEQPGDRAFNDPAVFAEFLGGFDAFAGDAGNDPAAAQPVPEFGVVVSFVGVQLVRFGPPRPATGSDRRDGVDQWLEGLAVVSVGSGDADDQRDTGTVRQRVDLRAWFASVDGVRAGQTAPFLALTDAASRTARDQSSMP